jgi:pimeloyl-ACP methyl ester carboxylesterase
MAESIIKVDHVVKGHDPPRSPVVFLHGFPDSPRIFDAYHAPAERQQPWLAGRDVFTVAFPNRHTHPRFPTWREQFVGRVRRDFHAAMDRLWSSSPTGELVLVAHDWGATYAWEYLRRHPGARVESMVALSVGSSFRYDVWEHGLFAAAWLYAFLFGLPQVLPLPWVRRGLADAIVSRGGYRSDTAGDLYLDTYHYRGGFLWPIKLPWFMLGAAHQKPYTEFMFPVLYIRSPLDRIASTSAFEQELRRREDCRCLVWDDVNHWFPEQHAQRVLAEIRTFVKPGRVQAG